MGEAVGGRRVPHLSSSEGEAIHLLERRVSILGVFESAITLGGQLWTPVRAQAERETVNLLDESVTLRLARDGILVQIDDVDIAKRLKDLTNVVLRQCKVERSNIESVCAQGRAGQLRARSAPRGKGSETHPLAGPEGPPEEEGPSRA